MTLPRMIAAPVPVTLAADPAWPEPRPASFRYCGQTIHVASVLERWIEAGRWWDREPERVVWRVADRAGGVYELAMERVTPSVWRLMNIWD